VSGSWPKIIRDPVHDIIPFEDTPCDRLLLDLIGTVEFQRLRRIKQLGMSELVFPGANHSRFAHSLGVMNMARRFLVTVEREAGSSLPEDQKTAILAASLLHDVGHGPFSHTFEKVTNENHEARTLAVITDSSTQVNKRLRKHEKRLPDAIAVFLDEDVEEGRRDVAIPAHLTGVVSSQLDADRFDYLLRDSYATGTQYGRFDANWLLQHLHLDDGRRFFLSHKGFAAAEAYVFSRYHMYRTVYFHKTTRAAEVMLRLLFKRFKDLLRTAKTKAAVVPNAPPPVVEAFSGSMGLDRYLALDDHAVSEFLKRCKASDDPILQSLGAGILDRNLFKAVEASDAGAADVGKFTSEAVNAVRKARLDPEYAFVEDTPGDTPYKPYDPDEAKPATQIYVQTTLGAIKELSTLSDTVSELRKRYSLLRYYFPESLRVKIDPIARTKLNRGRNP
jgi:HD superfamily phosphohydrolase